MMRGIVLLALAPFLAAQNAPDAAGILRQVGEKYANAKQYHFAATKTGEETGSLEIAVVKPGRFVFHANGRVIDGADDFDHVTYVSNGDTAWNYSAASKLYTRKSTTLALLDTEPPDIVPDTFVLQAEIVFLARYVSFAKAAGRARLLREEKLGSADCYVISITAPAPAYPDEFTWWIDKRRRVILREDTKPAGTRRPPSSTVFSEASIDEPLPDSLFQFAPPADAKLVNALPRDAGN